MLLSSRLVTKTLTTLSDSRTVWDKAASRTLKVLSSFGEKGQNPSIKTHYSILELSRCRRVTF